MPEDNDPTLDPSPSSGPSPFGPPSASPSEEEGESEDQDVSAIQFGNTGNFNNTAPSEEEGESEDQDVSAIQFGNTANLTNRLDPNAPSDPANPETLEYRDPYGVTTDGTTNSTYPGAPEGAVWTTNVGEDPAFPGPAVPEIGADFSGVRGPDWGLRPPVGEDTPPPGEPGETPPQQPDQSIEFALDPASDDPGGAEQQQPTPGDGEGSTAGAGEPYVDFIPTVPMEKDPATGEWRNVAPEDLPEPEQPPTESGDMDQTFEVTGEGVNKIPPEYLDDIAALGPPGPDRVITITEPVGDDGGSDGPGGFIQMFPTIKDPVTGELRAATPEEAAPTYYYYTDPKTGEEWRMDRTGEWSRIQDQVGDTGEATSSADPGPQGFAGDLGQPPPGDSSKPPPPTDDLLDTDPPGPDADVPGGTERQPTPGDGEGGSAGPGEPYVDFMPLDPMEKDPATGEWRNVAPEDLRQVGDSGEATSYDPVPPGGYAPVQPPDGFVPREYSPAGGFIQMFPTIKDPVTGEERAATPEEAARLTYHYFTDDQGYEWRLDPTTNRWSLVQDQKGGQGGDTGEATSSADPGGLPQFARDVPPVDQQPPPVDQQPPPVDQQPPPVDQQQPVDTPTLREGDLPPVDVPPTDLPPLGEDVPPPLEEQPTIGAQGTEELPPVDELGTTEPSTPTLAPNLLDPTAPGATLDNGLVPRIEQSPELTNAVNQNEDIANALERDPSSLDQIEQDLGLGQPSGVPEPSGAPDPGLGEPALTDPGVVPEPGPREQDADDITL